MPTIANRNRIFWQRRGKPKSNGNAPVVIPSRKRGSVFASTRRGRRYADTNRVSAQPGSNEGMLATARLQGKMQAESERDRKTLMDVEGRLRKTEQSVRHMADGHSVQRDGDVRMKATPTTPATSPLQSPRTDAPDVEMPARAPPMHAPKPPPVPPSREQFKTHMDVDSSATALTAKRGADDNNDSSSRRARTNDGTPSSSVLALPPTTAKSSRGRDEDDAQAGKKTRAKTSGSEMDAIVERDALTGKKFRISPESQFPDTKPPASAATLSTGPPAISRKPHAITASQFAQITDDEI